MADGYLLEESSTDVLLLEDSSGIYVLNVPQFMRPDGVGAVGGTWTGSYLDIDETVASDSDFLESPSNPTVTEFYTAALSDPVNPDAGDVFMRFRAGKSATGGRDISLQVELRQGDSTIVASLDAGLLPDAFTDYVYQLSPAEVAAITDFADLRFRFNPTTSGGGAGRAARLSWAEVQVPGPASSALTANVTRVTETDLALPLGRAKSIGQVTETDTARAVVRRPGIKRATETDEPKYGADTFDGALQSPYEVNHRQADGFTWQRLSNTPAEDVLNGDGTLEFIGPGPYSVSLQMRDFSAHLRWKGNGGGIWDMFLRINSLGHQIAVIWLEGTSRVQAFHNTGTSTQLWDSPAPAADGGGFRDYTVTIVGNLLSDSLGNSYDLSALGFVAVERDLYFDEISSCTFDTIEFWSEPASRVTGRKSVLVRRAKRGV